MIVDYDHQVRVPYTGSATVLINGAAREQGCRRRCSASTTTKLGELGLSSDEISELSARNDRLTGLQENRRTATKAMPRRCPAQGVVTFANPPWSNCRLRLTTPRQSSLNAALRRFVAPISRGQHLDSRFCARPVILAVTGSRRHESVGVVILELF